MPSKKTENKKPIQKKKMTEKEKAEKRAVDYWKYKNI
ncbi:hypothetical protein LCGC14_0711590 [marine sediment metagenome]|uniref:Uncharacterized protein n=1 Tax=marine sediment metagenome TaxID=412755 RepID=A0A0F9QJE5_9ZZZZ